MKNYSHYVTVEQLIRKALTQFKKICPKGEIRTLALWEGDGTYKFWSEATFHIEYVEESGGVYKETLITASIDQ